MILLPLLLVIFVVLAATSGLALRSRRSGVVDRESLPVAQNWAEARELLEAEPETLFQNPQGNDLTLNDLMFYKLSLRYPAMTNATLNEYLQQFRLDHP